MAIRNDETAPADSHAPVVLVVGAFRCRRACGPAPLRGQSAEFATFWGDHEIGIEYTSQKRLRNPEVGLRLTVPNIAAQ